ncbi:MAG: hypothetical protein V4584_03225 [Verrucomicrobiota bacterium]
MKSSLILATTTVFASSLLASRAALTAVGVYDENVTQTNTVDVQMPLSGSTGVAGTVVTSATFATDVAAAFTTGNGGVGNFDSGTLTSGSVIDIGFASGTKTLTLTDNLTQAYALGTSSAARISVSGAGFLSKNGGTSNFGFNLSSTGFAVNEHVVGLALTVLSRNGAGTPTLWTVTANYTDGVTAGSTSTAYSMNTSTGAGIDDAFSGIYAPAGHWITGFTVTGNNAFSSIDDIGFITAAVPEPSSALFGVLGLSVFLRRRKQA